MNKLLSLFISFAKIGGFTFGGGYAMLPMLQKEVVEKHKWATEDEIMDYYAIGQCTPGIIAVNTATFVGYNEAGVLGGIFATAGVIAPSMVIITIIAAFIAGFADMPIVQNAFAGIRSCVVVLVFTTVFTMGKKALKDMLTWILCVLTLLLSLTVDIPTVIYILVAFAVGVIYHSVKMVQTKNKEDENK